MEDSPFATPTPAGKPAAPTMAQEARAPESPNKLLSLSRSSSTSSHHSFGPKATAKMGMVRSWSSSSALSSASFTSSSASGQSSPPSTPSRIPRFATPTRASVAARGESFVLATGHTKRSSLSPSSSRRSLPFLSGSSSTPSLSSLARSRRTTLSTSPSPTIPHHSVPTHPPTHVPVRFRFSPSPAHAVTLPVPVQSSHAQLLASARAAFDAAQLAPYLPHHAAAATWRLKGELRGASGEVVMYKDVAVTMLLRRAAEYPNSYEQVEVVVCAVGGRGRGATEGEGSEEEASAGPVSATAEETGPEEVRQNFASENEAEEAQEGITCAYAGGIPDLANPVNPAAGDLSATVPLTAAVDPPDIPLDTPAPDVESHTDFPSLPSRWQRATDMQRMIACAAVAVQLVGGARGQAQGQRQRPAAGPLEELDADEDEPAVGDEVVDGILAVVLVVVLVWLARENFLML